MTPRNRRLNGRDRWSKEAEVINENSSVVRVLVGSSRRMPMESPICATLPWWHGGLARWFCSCMALIGWSMSLE
jgi:hypothetical protein